jgi:ketosteroid isomerase-like protein
MTSPQQDGDVRAVLEADDLRRAASVAGDVDALEQLFTADFTYTHSNGFREGRTAYLARIRAAQVRYLNVVRREAQVRVYAEVALVDGLASMTYQLPSQAAPNTLETLYLAVWLRSAGRWRMAAYASTQT